ncbi:MAG: peptidoglycan DD-metalloendopeptidase family protein [Acidimicrobiia bacterium]|nr:peptidoglycan DD-metalloendopeptidase family protein [Acidimicrobiia bacterium]
MNSSLLLLRAVAARRTAATLLALAVGAAVVVPSAAAFGADPEPEAEAEAKPPADEEAHLTPEQQAELEKLPDVATARRLVESTVEGALDAAADYEELAAEVREAQKEIREHEAEIPRLKEEIRVLEESVRSRAVQAYTGRDNQTASILDANSLVEAARRGTLIDAVNEHDHDVAQTLSDTRDLLDARRAQLEEQRADHEKRMKDLVKLQLTLDERMEEAQEMLRKSQVLEVWESLLENREADLADPAPDVGGKVVEPDNESVPQPAGSGDVDAPPFIAEMELCPIDAPVFFTNDWGNARSGGRKHKGTDVFAKRLTPNVAVADGVVSDASGGLGGIAVDLVGEDGTRYYYAHLQKINPEALKNGGKVEVGDVIGWTGDSGNAKGGSTHTHFQLHPNDGAPTNPYFSLFVACRDNFELPG